MKNRLFYGWIVVATFLIAGTTMWGIRFSYGLFFKSIATEFDLTRAATSMVLSVYMALGIIFTVVGGWAVDRYGPRKVFTAMGLVTALSLVITSQTTSLWHLFISYSLLLGIGTSAVWVVIMSTVSRWFDRKRGMALGIASSGIGLGTVVMSPLATFLIAISTWRTAYLVLGIIAFIIIVPLAQLLKKDPAAMGLSPDGVRYTDSTGTAKTVPVSGLSLREAAGTRSFYLIMLMWLFFSYNLLLITAHLVPHATDIGISVGSAAAVLSVVGGMNILGRVTVGSISDRLGYKSAAILSALLQGAAMLLLVWANQLWLFFVFAGVYGFAYGGFDPCLVAIASNAFGVRRIGAILGVIDIGFGIGAAIGPALAGLVFDATKSYSISFLIGAASMLVTVLLVLLTRRETAGKVRLAVE